MLIMNGVIYQSLAPSRSPWSRCADRPSTSPTLPSGLWPKVATDPTKKSRSVSMNCSKSSFVVSVSAWKLENKKYSNFITSTHVIATIFTHYVIILNCCPFRIAWPWQIRFGPKEGELNWLLMASFVAIAE